MKKFILLSLFVLPLTLSAQIVMADFVVLNEGADADYNKLEKVWKVHHQKAIDAGHKIAWSVWKRTPTADEGENAPDYVIFNQFSSMDQLEKYRNSFDYKKAVVEMKSGLRGKMSSRTINSILSKNVKKQVRTYTIQLLDATAFTGGDLKKGDKMSYVAMTQLKDDYEEYESKIWKPSFEKEILRNNFRWWALTKIVDRNEAAYKPLTHIVWNIGVENPRDFIDEDDYATRQMKSMMDSYRNMSRANELTLVYQNE